jgi:hypothetical protein
MVCVSMVGVFLRDRAAFKVGEQQP